MRISKRLQALFDLVPVCDYLVDIGTDHGLLMIAAVKSGRCKHAYGLDIVEGPLNHAKRNIIKHDLGESITLIKSDGLKNFDKKGNVFVIAGMGAETIIEIIDAYSFDSSQEIIVQSNTKNPWLRNELVTRGFTIVDETFLFDNKKPVFLMKIKKGKQMLSLKEQYLGPVLMNKHNAEYEDYLQHQVVKLERLYIKNEAFKDEYMILRNYLNEGVIK